MAGSNSFVDGISDVTECPICMEVVSDPKLLPCIHTFCLKCLNQLWTDKRPGDKVPCPMCRAEFIIPSGRFADLPRNSFIEKLIETKKASAKIEIPKCDVCVCRRVDREAANFCVECQQNLCSECTDVHKLLSNTKCHLVVTVKDCSKIGKIFGRSSVMFCDQHKEKKIKLYCGECRAPLCTTCFLLKHNGHEFSDFTEVVKNYKDQIRKGIEKTKNIIPELIQKTEHMDEFATNFTANASQIEREILQRGDEMKRMVDTHVQYLLQKLNSEKSKELEELRMAKKDTLAQKINCESFKNYAEEVLSKANDVDIARMAPDIIKKAEGLKNVDIVRIQKPPVLSFVPSCKLAGSTCERTDNIIGRIINSPPLSNAGRETVERSPLDMKSTDVTAPPYANEMKTLHTIVFPSSVGGIAMVDEKLFVAVNPSRLTEVNPLKRTTTEIMIYNSATIALQSSIPVPRCLDVWDMTASGDVVFVSCSGGTIYRIQLSDQSITSWSLGRSRTSLSTTKTGNILVCSRGRNIIYEYSPGGILQREIGLYFRNTCRSEYIHDSERAVQLDEDRFLVCQVWESNLHRVCLVDNKERLIRKSFGGSAGSGCSRLKHPYRLVVDRFGYILIADESNNRVVLLDKELEYVKDLIPASANLKGIFTLYLDECKSRLFVGAGCELIVFELDGNV